MAAGFRGNTLELPDADAGLMKGSMKKTVANLTVDELRLLIQDAVDAALIEFFGDPDEGLELRPEFLERLEERAAAVRTGEADLVSFEEAFLQSDNSV